MFGNKLRKVRQRKKLTQERLAVLSGLSPHYVSDIERGNRDVSLSAIIALCRALRVKPGTVLDHLI